MSFDSILTNLPEVKHPTQKRLAFKEKLKWTGIILVIYFILGFIPLFGLSVQSFERFEFISIILGAQFGSIISLGIGPIVTASIVLQLLNGSGLMKFDLTTPDGKRRFQGLQKLLAVGFIILEALIYVFMGGLSPAVGVSPWILVFQLLLGGILILFMDEVISKWGFGSGISLFIAAGVSKTIFVRAFNFLPNAQNPEVLSGVIPSFFQFLGRGDPVNAGINLSIIAATVVVFLIVVYFQSMKVEIPLSFGRVRGQGMRWPLQFLYVSNIPVILVAALLANIQLFARLLSGGSGGIVGWVNPPRLLQIIISGGVGNLSFITVAQSIVYVLIMMGGAVLFGVFWVQTAGLDAKSQAKQILDSGLQIPGFRKDQRILERLLQRYIPYLTVMGSLAIGFLAALADLTSALGTGTGILLTVMIVYKLYEEIAQQHMYDMNPMMRKFMGGQ